MNINLEIINEEDIHYLNELPEDKRNNILKTAITIGLKSIHMSEVKMDCHSYIDPIREIVSESTEKNTNQIQNIDDKLDSLLNIKTNSSRKGRLSENICIRRLIQQYPDWEFNDVAYVGHEGDCRAISSIGEILYEFKNYDTNVPRDQINKFYKDLETTGIKLGIFISNTSGIVGKKDLEWEIIHDDTLIIYISNIGFNGHGCIMATELMLALMKNNILDYENHWLLYQNYETDQIYKNLIDSIDNYRRDNEMIHKLKKHVKEHRNKMNSMIDILESEVFQIILNSETTYSKILGLVESIQSKNEITKNFNFDEFIHQNNYNEKFIILFTQFYKIIKKLNLIIHSVDNEWFIHKENVIIAKTKTLKSKIQLIILKYPDNLENFNPLYEEFKDMKIIIELNDNYKIWEIIQMRLKIN
tara:strand:+ start:334 stop:1581 length:1248 start_codon:yes stop_codon:yes gene_type:complete